MNTFKKVLMFALVSLSIAGCGKKEDSTAVRSTRRADRGAYGTAVAPGGTTTTGLQLVGVVTTDPSYEDTFNESVRGFLNSVLPENYVGYVSPTASNNTGVFFGGRVALQGGSIRNVQAGQQLQIAPNSSILVAVYDYFPGQSSMGPIPVPLNTATGTITGNTARITFYDSVGSITLEGQFDMNTFQGAFYYDNTVKYDNTAPGGNGVLGGFSIPTCQFFVCQ